ncbi:hypothetical protein D3C72_2260350 [compost metagenome]
MFGIRELLNAQHHVGDIEWNAQSGNGPAIRSKDWHEVKVKPLLVHPPLLLHIQRLLLHAE